MLKNENRMKKIIKLGIKISDAASFSVQKSVQKRRLSFTRAGVTYLCFVLLPY